MQIGYLFPRDYTTTESDSKSKTPIQFLNSTIKMIYESCFSCDIVIIVLGMAKNTNSGVFFTLFKSL